MAQLFKRPTSAQVIISQFVSLSPTLGSVLPALDSLSPSLSAPPPFMLSVFQKWINVKKKKSDLRSLIQVLTYTPPHFQRVSLAPLKVCVSLCCRFKLPLRYTTCYHVDPKSNLIKLPNFNVCLMNKNSNRDSDLFRKVWNFLLIRVYGYVSGYISNHTERTGYRTICVEELWCLKNMNEWKEDFRSQKIYLYMR